MIERKFRKIFIDRLLFLIHSLKMDDHQIFDSNFVYFTFFHLWNFTITWSENSSFSENSHHFPQILSRMKIQTKLQVFILLSIVKLLYYNKPFYCAKKETKKEIFLIITLCVILPFQELLLGLWLSSFWWWWFCLWWRSGCTRK